MSNAKSNVMTCAVTIFIVCKVGGVGIGDIPDHARTKRRGESWTIGCRPSPGAFPGEATTNPYDETGDRLHFQ